MQNAEDQVENPSLYEDEHRGSTPIITLLDDNVDEPQAEVAIVVTTSKSQESLENVPPNDEFGEEVSVA